MISSYQEALHFLYENLPMFQRVGAAAIKKDLTNTYRLCALLGDPQNKFRSVHVAGTNGKGSTCHMLASVLQAAGYKTGLYTSPHLKEFTERIRVNGAQVSPDYIVDFVNRMRPHIEEIHPSFFEITVCMAFDYFARQQVDVAIVEVGLGGRLDSTNVITPILSVITNISWDHMDMLGDTLPEIAEEKAGIIKRGVPVVISERQQEVEDVFTSRAAEQSSPLIFASDIYAVEGDLAERVNLLREGKSVLGAVRFPLPGWYQQKNLPGVMAAVDHLKGYFTISNLHLKEGLEEVVVRTGLRGRWQKLNNSPTVICDTAHNPEGIRWILRQLGKEQFKTLHMVLGMVKDKDVGKVLEMLPQQARYYFCQAKIPRAMAADALRERALEFGLRGEAIADVNEALRKAHSMALAEDLIFIGGSTYVVAEIDEL